MRLSIKLSPQFFENFEKMVGKNIVFKKLVKIFEVLKTEKHVKEPCQVYMCTKFYVNIIKNGRVLVF